MDAPRYIVNVEGFVWDGARYLMLVRGASESIAPGTLTPPGGKAEDLGPLDAALESTLRREIREEAGVEVGEMAYVESHIFEAEGDAIFDVVFLCRYAAGTPRALDAEEVASLEWLTPEEAAADPRTMPWTRASLARAEAERRRRGW